MKGGGPKAPRCPLGKATTTRLGARESARIGYRETGVVVIFPDQLTDPYERQIVKNIAEREYASKPASNGRKDR